jgi:hypothetical protein
MMVAKLAGACLRMSFFAKPVPTFAGHALAQLRVSEIAGLRLVA